MGTVVLPSCKFHNYLPHASVGALAHALHALLLHTACPHAHHVGFLGRVTTCFQEVIIKFFHCLCSSRFEALVAADCDQEEPTFEQAPAKECFLAGYKELTRFGTPCVPFTDSLLYYYSVL